MLRSDEYGLLGQMHGAVPCCFFVLKAYGMIDDFIETALPTRTDY